MMKNLLFAAFGLCCLISSASAQNVEWKTITDPQEIVIGDTQHRVLRDPDLPIEIHFGYPIRSYRVIGMVITHGNLATAGPVEHTEALRRMAVAAKHRGADALIMLRLTDEDRGLISDAASNPAASTFAKALAITWRVDGEPFKHSPH